jgi:hypothetical protein
VAAHPKLPLRAPARAPETINAARAVTAADAVAAVRVVVVAVIAVTTVARATHSNHPAARAANIRKAEKDAVKANTAVNVGADVVVVADAFAAKVMVAAVNADRVPKASKVAARFERIVN